MSDPTVVVAPLPAPAPVVAAKPTSVTTVTATIEPLANNTTTSTTTATSHAPGWKSSEGILAFVAAFLSSLFGAGIIPTAGPAQVIAVVAALALTSAGFSVSRGLTKAAP